MRTLVYSAPKSLIVTIRQNLRSADVPTWRRRSAVGEVMLPDELFREMKRRVAAVHTPTTTKRA